MTATTKSFRNRWLAVHLYLGMSLGLWLAVIGITGSLLVFYVELDEVLNPELVIADPSAPRLSYQALVDAIQRAEPDRLRGWRLEISDNPQRMITARYYQPQETEHLGFAPLMVTVHPQTGAVLKQRFWGQYAMTWIYDLHYTLLLASTGKLIMAIVGGLLLVALISGLVLWWPQRGKWRAALSIKRNASAERLTYDVHKVAGAYGFALLLLLALTGIVLEVPEYVNPLIAKFSPLQTPAKPQSLVMHSNQARITVDRAVSVAQNLFPDAQLSWIETPHDAAGSYRINLYQAGEPSRRFPKTNVWVDQYSGRILQVNNPDDFSKGDSLITWLHPLHSGEALALPGRLLVLLAGLLGPLLFVTGVIRWLHKRRAKQLRRMR